MKRDPYKHKERWLRWKETCRNRIPEISIANSKIIMQFLEDMEVGINTSIVSKKGQRSYPRLNTLRNKLVFFARQFKSFCNVDDLTKLTEQQVCNYFTSMRSGEIKTEKGEKYKSVADFVKTFKAFWHWYQKIARKKEINIEDITIYLDSSCTKPEWVYLTENQVKTFFENAKPDYKALIMFLFDSGIRSPTELINIKVSDLLHNCKELNIREETSKTFGRRIKLMLCSNLLQEHIKNNNLSPEDYLFDIRPPVVNRYLKRLSGKLFGDKPIPAGQKYSDLTMYDFRHISCCYWLPRYKSESALKFRFGWKKSDKIHYYSEMLGMRDTIREEDMLVDITKTELEKRLTKAEHENEMMKDEMEALREQSQKMMELVQGALGISNMTIIK